MTFLKQNWFKLFILLSVSIGIFVFIRHTQKQNLLENQMKCSQAGIKYFNERKQHAEEIKTNRDYLSIRDPEYRFNTKTNTCLYKGTEFEIIGDVLKTNSSLMYIKEAYVIDLYTNEQLVRWNSSQITGEGWEDVSGSQEEFDTKVREIFY